MVNEIGQGLEAHVTAVRRWEDQVHALVAWDEAEALRRLEGVAEGPLKGWAVGVKDIFDVAGLPTRCGVDFLPSEAAQKHAGVVEQLLSRGAFVFSKTVTTAFAYFDPGPTRNPWNLDHTPGGSSSGSAAAVACGMVRLALGTQTVASVNRPASYCGVVGFKPTYGRVSVSGVFPLSPSVDTVGFFTQDVSDMQTAFSALVGEAVVQPPSSMRVGLVEDLYVAPAEEEMVAALKTSAEKLEAGGLEVQHALLPSISSEAYENHWSLVAAEVAHSHRELFAAYRERYPAKLQELILRGQGLSSAELSRIEAHGRQLREEISSMFDECDFLLTPSAPGTAPAGIDATGDPRFSLIWTYAGFPTVTVPALISKNGLPLGVQLVGPLSGDLPLLAAALRLESMLDFQIPWI